MSNYFKHKMRSKSPGQIAGWIVLGILAAAALATIFGFIVMWLWNALMPTIFGLITIGYWQAVGLFILFKILFGGLGSGSGKSGRKDKNGCKEKDSSNDFSKWEKYNQFWEEEGNEAYQEYVRRKSEDAEEE